MAGIFGYFAFEKDCLIAERLRNFVYAIKNEGYTVTNFIYENVFMLGRAEIQSGQQKQITRSKPDIIATIYDDKNDDNLEESILTLFKQGELGQIKNLNGPFIAAIYDQSTDGLTLLNDRFGLIKLFYYIDDKHFIFCPKIKPLSTLGIDKSLRKDAVIDFFLFGYLLGQKTLFKNIYQLPPASILKISKKEKHLKKYWSYDFIEKYDSNSKENFEDELNILWIKAVERTIKKNESIIIPLSGGLDSRAILAAALKCTSRDKIITFTFGERNSFDLEIGKIVSKKSGVNNIPLNVEKYRYGEQFDLSISDSEGMIDATPYFPVFGYQKMREFGQYIQSGYIGDFIMGSHMFPEMTKTFIKKGQELKRCADIFLEKEKLHKLEEIKKLLNPSIFPHIINPISIKEYEKDIDTNLANLFFKYFLENHTDKFSYFSVFRFRNTFKYSNPFLDNALVDFMRKISIDLRIGQNLYKSMLLKNHSELFKLPVKNNYGLALDTNKHSLLIQRALLYSMDKSNKLSSMLMGKNIFVNKRNNYLDYGNLLRNNAEYQSFIQDKIEKVEKREYFNREYIKTIWRSHLQGMKNHAPLIGLLTTFELFLEKFIDT